MEPLISAQLRRVGVDVSARGVFVDVDAQTRLGRKVDVAVSDYLVLLKESIAQSCVNLLLHEEVGYAGVNLHAS